MALGLFGYESSPHGRWNVPSSCVKHQNFDLPAQNRLLIASERRNRQAVTEFQRSSFLASHPRKAVPNQPSVLDYRAAAQTPSPGLCPGVLRWINVLTVHVWVFSDRSQNPPAEPGAMGQESYRSPLHSQPHPHPP